MLGPLSARRTHVNHATATATAISTCTLATSTIGHILAPAVPRPAVQRIMSKMRQEQGKDAPAAGVRVQG